MHVLQGSLWLLQHEVGTFLIVAEVFSAFITQSGTDGGQLSQNPHELYADKAKWGHMHVTNLCGLKSLQYIAGPIHFHWFMDTGR